VTCIGLSDRYSRSGHPLDECPVAPLQEISSLSGYQYFATDFLTYDGPLTGGDLASWRVAETNAAVVGLEADAQFGALKCATAGADGDTVVLQLLGESFRYVVGKRLWCFIRVNLTDVDDQAAIFGLFPLSADAAIDTYAEAVALDDGIFFKKAEAATEFDFDTRKDDVQTDTPLCTGTFTDSAYRIIGFTVDLAGNVHAWDGTTLDDLTEVATVNVNSTSLPDDEDLTLTFGFENGTGADAEDLTVDWVFIAQER
jgi:hypothetical protein